jgi:hypothetical protein
MPAPFFGRSMVKATQGGISFSGSGIGCKVGGPEFVDGGGGVQTFFANRAPCLLLAKGTEACQKHCMAVQFKKKYNAKLYVLIETILINLVKYSSNTKNSARRLPAFYWKSVFRPLSSTYMGDACNNNFDSDFLINEDSAIGSLPVPDPIRLLL